MNRQKFLAELSRLLGFMSSWDREAEMNKYIEMLDAAGDEEALIESLGTPTQLAISVALGYKPTPRPGTQPPEPEPSPEPASGPEAAAAPEREGTPEPAPEPPPPPPPKKRDELQIVTDGEFEYGMELAILMGEPISAAVESALNGEYLPDPDFSLEEILREARGEADEDGIFSESVEAPAENTEEAPAAPEVKESAHPEEKTAPPEPGEAPPVADTDTAKPETAQGNTPEQPAPIAPELPPPAEPEGGAAEESAPRAEPETAEETAGDKPAAGGEQEAAASETGEAAEKPDETEKPKEAGSESGPVFDAATAPLPEAVKSAGDEAGETAPSGESADVTETQVNHPPHLVFDPANFAPLPPDEVTEDLQAEEPERPRGTLRPAGTAAYVLFALIIGVPLTLLLVLIGVPVMLLGLGAIGAAVYAGTHIIAALSMFSDILLVVGTGLAICAVGLLIAWLGLWLSIELGSLWINAVMLRLGRALCFKKEADAE